MGIKEAEMFWQTSQKDFRVFRGEAEWTTLLENVLSSCVYLQYLKNT